MSDMGDDFNAMRQESQERRAFNRQSSAQVLEHHGVKFTSRNGGAHLIVEHNGICVDFWPGTGKWIPRDYDVKGRGVFPLLRYMKVAVKGSSMKGSSTNA